MEKDINSKPIIIAIDGYSSCGKSTLAKQIAKKLDYVFIDSGAMYRATTLYFLRHKIDITKENQIIQALSHIHVTFKNIQGQNTTFLNGENVEEEIRSLPVSNWVSEISAISSVRLKMVALQRAMKHTTGIVMDGRDIGTVVFPNADIKLFVTADPIVRAQRRFNELISKNHHADLEEVISNLNHRDKIDTEREDSPLKMAEDAILLNNTNLSIAEQYDWVMSLILKIISDKKNIA